MFEGIALHGQFPFHRTVIDGAQVAHVKEEEFGQTLMPFRKVSYSTIRLESTSSNSRSRSPRKRKNCSRRSYMFRPCAFCLSFQFLYELSCKGKETATVGRRGEHFHHLVGGISRVGTFEPCDDAPEPGQVVCYGGLHGEQVIPASLFCAGSHHDLGNAGIPFRRKSL